LRKDELIRGDKLRDLVLIVYLNNKYGLGTKIDDAKVQSFIGYSRSGFNTAINESGYFVRKGDEIMLSEKGERYVKKELMPYYKAFNPIGYFLIFLGSLLFLQWYLLTYFKFLLILDWLSGLSIIVGGLLIRFALLPTIYWFLKIRRKV